MKKSLSVSVCLLFAGTLVAGDGAIPVWEPITITEPGKYRLISNIVDSRFCESTIIIDSDDVNLDLNGFTIETTGVGIYAWGTYNNISIHDGVVKNTACDVAGVHLDGLNRFSLRRLVITGLDEGLNLWGTDGLVEEVFVELASFQVYGSNIRLRHNHSRSGLTANCSGSIISENTIGDDGLEVFGSGNLVMNNVSRNSTYGAGMKISGDHNQVLDNVLTGNVSFGLRITGDHNIYRGNLARDNGGTGCETPPGSVEFCDEGTGNTSHGDNYMPDQM